jgi:hypothetical protein
MTVRVDVQQGAQMGALLATQDELPQVRGQNPIGLGVDADTA